MKTNLRLFRVLIAATALLTGCGSSSPSSKPANTGKAYEVIVSASQEVWDGAAGDTLRSILLAPVEMINQREPLFNVLRVRPSATDGLILRHRNLVLLRTSPSATPAMTVAYDVHAAPQIIVTVTAPDAAALAAYLDSNRKELIDVLSLAERQRALDYAARYKEKGIEEEIMRLFGMKIDIPKGYKLAKIAGDDFLWIRNEYPVASQGIFLYSRPFGSSNDFRQEALLAARDRFAARIPGPSEGSYMTTNPDMLSTRYLRIGDRSWSEMRGFWDVAGDFMGGPFVSYSTLDEQRRRIVTIDCYVYSPKYPKRNLLRGLESLVYSVSFPDSTTTAALDKDTRIRLLQEEVKRLRHETESLRRQLDLLSRGLAAR